MPESGAERTLDRSSRVSALVGDAANCVFLLESESGRKRSEPVADSGEGGAARQCVVFWSHAMNEFESAPGNGAVRLLDEGSEPLYAMLSNKRVRSFTLTEQPWLEHSEGWGFLCATRGSTALETPSRPGASLSNASTIESKPRQGLIDVHHLHATSTSSRRSDGGRRRTSDRRYRSSPERLAPGEVEVARRGVRFPERPRPQGPDPPLLVSPQSLPGQRPSAIEFRVAARFESLLGEELVGDDA